MDVKDERGEGRRQTMTRPAGVCALSRASTHLFPGDESIIVRVEAVEGLSRSGPLVTRNLAVAVFIHLEHRGSPATFAGKSDDEVKEEFRVLAERRVRLGLLLSEIGQSNNIEVSADEVQREIVSEARRHPGREKAVLEHYRKTPEAQQSLRAPLYEDKVVDFVLEMAQVTDRTVSIEELLKNPDGVDEPATEAKEPTSGRAKKGE